MLNEQIRDKEVRLLSENGEQLGIFSAKEALQKAEEANLDLVKISPKANPPVCKIMDYSKYKFDQAKKAKEAKKKQKGAEVKEIRLSPNIDTHDVEVKARNAIKFLKAGDKVKVTLRFRGRELGYTNAGRQVLLKFADICSEYGTVEKNATMDGRFMYMYLAPIVEK